MSAGLRKLLQEKPSKAPRALLGFDGYLDQLYKVVRQRNTDGKVIFENIHQFGTDILTRAGLSGGFELSRISQRFGGNSPLMSMALAALGVRVDCVGALGLPEPGPAFAELGRSARLHSVASHALTMALEFDDGKIMLGDTESFENLDWNCLVQALGLEKISALAQQADLLALLNWANMHKATDLWQGLLTQVLDKGLGGAKKKIFFDLSDLTRCGVAETRSVLALLGRFRAHGEVSLGVNENEARQLGGKLGLPGADGDLGRLGLALLKAIPVDCLVMHPRDKALVFQGGAWQEIPGRLVEKPMLSTGGGDNFNAGYCVGLLLGLEAAEAASLGVQVSSHYVAMGRSPTREDLLGWIGEP